MAPNVSVESYAGRAVVPASNGSAIFYDVGITIGRVRIVRLLFTVDQSVSCASMIAKMMLSTILLGRISGMSRPATLRPSHTSGARKSPREPQAVRAGEQRAGTNALSGRAMRIADIYIYPVKGLRGLSVPVAAVEPWGLAGDRRWMVIDSARRLISQREAHGLALIQAAIEGEAIRLSAPGRPSIFVSRPVQGAIVETQMWQERVPAVLADKKANDWITAVRGSHCELVYMAEPQTARPIAGSVGMSEDRVSFADEYPLLLTNEASLIDLVGRSTDSALSMNRFRANLVVHGAAAWEEDFWSELTIGGVPFAVAGGCERCIVTSIDQMSGERHRDNEPLRTLMSFRRNARGRPIFGVNLIPRAQGTIAVNDGVEAGYC